MQIPVIPEDIFFTTEFTQVAELDDSSATAAGLVSEILTEGKMSQSWVFYIHLGGGFPLYFLGLHTAG